MKREYGRDWMTPEPVTVTPDTSVARAYYLMKMHRIRRLPVTEGEWLVGMVTMGDLWSAIASLEAECDILEMASRMDRLAVMQIMTHEVVAVTPDASIKAACELMLKHKVGGLPVVVEGRLVGILAESDIFRLVARYEFVNDNHD